MTNEPKSSHGDAEYLTFSQAARTLPHRPHSSTINRWRQRGICGVRLKTCLLGGRRFTTKAWLAEFLDASNEARGVDDTPVVEPPRGRDKGFERAADELDAAGF